MRTTEEVQAQAEHYRKNPIYGTDLNRPMSEVISELRNRMTVLRGQIHDFQFGFPGWRERTEPVSGLLTCGIVTLYSVLQELEKFEAEIAGAQKTPNVELSGHQRPARKDEL